MTKLVDGIAHHFETNTEKIVLGYYYRKKRVQENDKLYGAKFRVKKKILRKLKEKEQDIRWKAANIIVKTAYEEQYAIVLEKLDKRPANNMVKKMKDKQPRHRIFQASFRDIQRAIEEKAESTVFQ